MEQPRIRVAQNFYLDEFIDPETYFSQPDHGLSKIDFRLFTIAQMLRVLSDEPMTINNWWNYYQKIKDDKPISLVIQDIIKNESIRKWSGFRPKSCPIGARKSQHKLGMALDPKDMDENLYEVLSDYASLFHDLGVRRVEDESITIGWLHIDLRTKGEDLNGIRIIDRTKQTGLIKF